VRGEERARELKVWVWKWSEPPPPPPLTLPLTLLLSSSLLKVQSPTSWVFCRRQVPLNGGTCYIYGMESLHLCISTRSRRTILLD
jgi:hypothetical protein